MRAAIVRWSARIDQWFHFPRIYLPAACCLLLFCLAGCAQSPANMENAVTQATTSGFAAKTFNAGDFRLFGLQKAAPEPGRLLSVYIEGDGRAWRRRNRPSADPTPRHALALTLALHDPRPAVLYLARPCQFQPAPLPATCNVSVWTSHRYSEAVIAAMNAAITEAAAGFDKVALVGYSGGGSVATLIAARRSDVAFLITVAANLDHARWTELHHVAPLSGSLNAADVARDVQRIPQVHYLGGKDDVVTGRVVESFAARMTDRSQTRIRSEPSFDHECCWADAWPRLLTEARYSLPVADPPHK